MFHHVNIIFSDFIGLLKTVGLYISLRWIVGIVLNLKTCIRDKNLQAADTFAGLVPFSVKRKNHKLIFSANTGLGGIREIWVRDVYLGNGLLQIPDEGVVVDLGANIGIFTLLALTEGCGRVISVEPNITLNNKFNELITINNFYGKVDLQRYFIGGKTDIQCKMLLKKENSGAEFITVKEFLERNNLFRIDFLKCDIEGSEYEFLGDDKIFRISENVAIEIHGSKTRRDSLIKSLERIGLKKLSIRNDSDGCIALFKKGIK